MSAGSFFPDLWKAHILVHGPLHFPIHFAVFAISGLVVFGWEPSPRRRTVFFIGVLALGLLLELLQRAIYPIRFEWRDFLVDFAGVLFAMLVTAVRISFRAARKQAAVYTRSLSVTPRQNR